MTVRFRTPRAIVVLALAILAAACSGDSTSTETTLPGAPATTTTTSQQPTTAPPSTTTAPPTTTTTTAPTTTTEAPGILIEVIVLDGSVDAPQRPAVPRGELVTILVTADVTDEVHVHGYDLFAAVAPGSPAEIEFTADIPGIFEVELESSHMLLLELEVS
jgi:heme/copper-type cytochrome/quinol oxidase subunit 2